MRIVISNADGRPIYEQVERQIRAQIIDGTLSEGSPLPSIRKLARELQISVITTKRAYDDLEQEGLIDSVAGKGTFVAVHNRELLREKKLTAIEEQIAGAVREAQRFGLTVDEIHDMVELLWKEAE